MSEKKENNKDKDLVEGLQAKITELEESVKRSQADFMNLKRRTDEERMKNLKYSGERELSQILPVFDNFKRASEHIPEDLSKNEWAVGILQIEQYFKKVLEDIGIKKIECMGMPADYNFHEIISQTKGKKDIIVQEVESGYIYNDKVIRATKVIVGDGNE
jgi:molecular chaperone GrpE